jgi:hypothetical protein
MKFEESEWGNGCVFPLEYYIVVDSLKAKKIF